MCFKKIIEVIGERFRIFEDISSYGDYFFTDSIDFSKDAIEKLFNKIDLKNTYELLIEAVENISEWTKDSIIKPLEEVSTKLEIKRKDYYQAIRAGLTGKLVSPDLVEIMLSMGKEKVVRNLKTTLEYISTT